MVEFKKEDVKSKEKRSTDVADESWLLSLLIILDKILGNVFVYIPCRIIAATPKSDAILSIGFLYIFLQMLGYMWLLVVAMASQWVKAAVEFMLNPMTFFGDDLFDIQTIFAGFCKLYCQYALARVVGFMAYTIYVLGWDSYYDFPTIRRLLAEDLSEVKSATGCTLRRGGISVQRLGEVVRNRSLDILKDTRETRESSFFVDVNDISQAKKRMYSRNEIIKPADRTTITRPSGMNLSTKESIISEDDSDHPRKSSNLLELPDSIKKTPVTDASSEDHLPSSPDSDSRTRVSINSINSTRVEGNTETGFTDVNFYHKTLDTIDSNWESGNELTRNTKFTPDQWRRRKRAKQVVILLPLLLLNVLALFLTIVALINSSHETMDPSGRVQRLLRYAALVLFFQWATQYFLTFPTWYIAIYKNASGSLLFLSIFACIGFSRLFVWIVAPIGTNNAETILGLRAAVVDSLLLLLTMIWMLYIVFNIVKSSVSLRISGYMPTRFSIDSIWRDHILLFKFGVLFGTTIHFFRGCLSLSIGMINAQCDAIVFSAQYPLLLASIWIVTYQCSRLRSSMIKPFLVAVPCAMLIAHCICLFAQMEDIGVKFIVVLHIIRQIFKSPWFVDKNKYTIKKKMGPRGSVSTINNTLLLMYGSVLFVLVGSLLSLTLLSILQKVTEVHAPTIDLNYNPQTNDFYINHVISALTFKNDTSKPVTFIPPRYAVCSSEVHNLNTMDFALLSEAAYYEADTFEGAMNAFFPPSANLPWELVNAATGIKSPLTWYEVRFPTIDVTVFAVRGTDPANISDILEDIRMWTESSSVGLLSIVFPTVRLWTKKASEMMIYSLRIIIDVTTHAENKQEHKNWAYLNLLKRVESIPSTEQVLLTGHSMGGSMAAIVGALTQRHVFAVQPPGIYHSIAKFAFDQKKDIPASWVHHEQITIVVEGDFINNSFDDHGGMVQTLQCAEPDLSLQMACHMLEGTMCHILRHCGDPRGRWTHCEWEFTPPVQFTLQFVWESVTSVATMHKKFGPAILITTPFVLMWYLRL